MLLQRYIEKRGASENCLEVLVYQKVGSNQDSRFVLVELGAENQVSGCSEGETHELTDHVNLACNKQEAAPRELTNLRKAAA